MPHDNRLPLRLGIIGLGAMGSEMLAAAAGSPDVTVTRIADVNPAAVARVGAYYPGVGTGSDPELAADSDDVDAVYIATPPSAHTDLAVTALTAGKAVFCEKPLAVSLADGRRLVDLAEATGLATAVNFALSDRHAVLHIERALRSGHVGDVRGVDVRLTFPQWPRTFQAGAGWVAGGAEGGFVREVLSHFAYLTDRLLGPMEVETASVDHPDGDEAAEVSARGLLRAGGVPVHVSGFSGVAGHEWYEWTLWGTEQSYTLRNWSDLYESGPGGWTPVSLHAAERGSERSRLSLFARAVRGEPVSNLADFAVAFRVQQVVEAFHLARTRPHDLRPQDHA